MQTARRVLKRKVLGDMVGKAKTAPLSKIPKLMQQDLGKKHLETDFSKLVWTDEIRDEGLDHSQTKGSSISLMENGYWYGLLSKD